MPRVQGCSTHTAFLPYIFTPSFPGVTHREAIVYISVWIIISGQKTEDRVYVERHKYKTIFSFRASFFDSGIKKSPRIAPRAVSMRQFTAVAAFLSSGWALMRAMKFISAVAAPLPLATALCLTPESSRQ